jgi:outer membrane protein OmpA-like peptidoglycan-associated protein
MRPLIPLLPWLILVGSCSSPPQPPGVDEANRRPANAALAVELQVCKSALQNTRILASESNRLADATTATLERLAVRQQALASLQAASPSSTLANRVFTVWFGYGSTRVALPADAVGTLVELAREAPLVLLRGRTDGATDSLAESRIARDRAAAVRDHLVAAGVDPARIRATHQPSGDHAASNTTPAGRSLNRRVEIELYRTLPMAVRTASVEP